jgi:pilus assembly protein CpaB
MRRTRPRISRVLFVLSGALAVMATLAVQARLRTLEARAAAGEPGRPIVLTKTDLERGTVLGEGMLTTRDVPARFVPPGALEAPEEAAGRTLESSVVQGEPLTAARLAPTGGPVAALVPPGLRAVAVPSTLPMSAIRAGDHVEIHATFASGQPHTEVVATGAEVLSVIPSQTLDGEENGGVGTLILLLGPESAERLAFARTFADLSVAVVSAEEERAVVGSPAGGP